MSTSVEVVPQPSAGVVAQVGETASSAMAAMAKAQVEAKSLVAIGRPRNYDNARAKLLARCASPRFAETAEYAKPVGGGKKATGASIRMMEEVARQWGNVDVQSSIIFDEDSRRIIRVTAMELETNYSSSVEVILEKTVERRNPRDGDEVISQRTNSTGAVVYRIRADEDAFLVKQNAAISKARRECIRNIVPGDLVEEALEICRDVRRGEVKKDPSAARKRIADAFFGVGVMPNQLAEYLGKTSLEAVTDAEVDLLRALFTAMRDEGATWADLMDERVGRGATKEQEPAPEKKRGGSTALKDSLAKKAAPAPVAPVEDVAPVEGAAPPPLDEDGEGPRCIECRQLKGSGHARSCWYTLHPKEEAKYNY